MNGAIITFATATGMQAFVEAIQTNLTSANLWEELVGVGAFLGLMVVFAFGYRIVRRLINGVSKGKAKC